MTFVAVVLMASLTTKGARRPAEAFARGRLGLPLLALGPQALGDGAVAVAVVLLLQPEIACGQHDVRLFVVGHVDDEPLQQDPGLFVSVERHLDAGQAESRGRVPGTQPHGPFEVHARLVVLLIALAERAQLEVGVEVVRVDLQRAQKLPGRRVVSPTAISARPYIALAVGN